MKISELQASNLVLYDTDKFGLKSSWTKLDKPHSYAKFYDDFFLKRKDKYNLILEIGVKYGGSVRLIHDYLKHSKIIGMDIKNEWKNGNIKDYPRLLLKYRNVYDFDFWKYLPGMYDIIIDDGPHTLNSQIFAVKNFINYLDENGILIIEDIHSKNLQLLLDEYKGNKDKLTIYDWTKESGRVDDIIITIQK